MAALGATLLVAAIASHVFTGPPKRRPTSAVNPSLVAPAPRSVRPAWINQDCHGLLELTRLNCLTRRGAQTSRARPDVELLDVAQHGHSNAIRIEFS